MKLQINFAYAMVFFEIIISTHAFCTTENNITSIPVNKSYERNGKLESGPQANSIGKPVNVSYSGRNISPEISRTTEKDVVIPSFISSGITVAPQAASGSQALFNVGRFPVVNDLSKSSDPFQSPDSVYIGGQPIAGWDPVTGLFKGQETRPGSLVITGQPWGPYNGATLESLIVGQNVDAQNGVCALDWRQGAGSICVGDGVAQYIGVTGPHALVISSVASFTPSSVVMKTPLSSEQIAKLRVGMYISTNYVNGLYNRQTYDMFGNAKLLIQNYYQGVISGWSSDGRTISVSAWVIPAFNKASALIPGAQQGDMLDTSYSNYGVPTVFIGNSNNISARNEYLDYQGWNSGDDSFGNSKNIGKAKSLVHAMSGEEMDLRYWATHPNEVHLDGITISVAGDPGTPMGRNALTADSYLMSLSGDIHNTLVLDGPADGNIIGSHSFNLHGNEGTYYPIGITATTPGSRPTQTNFWFSDFADTADKMNLLGYQTAYGTNVGAVNTAYHFGLHVNGDLEHPTDFSKGGANWGEIEWNPKGANSGTIALCAQNENCAVMVDGGGHLALPNGASIMSSGYMGGNGLVVGKQPKGHAASIGIYADDGTGSNMVEVMRGSQRLLDVDRNGNFQLLGSGSFASLSSASTLVLSGGSGWVKEGTADGIMTSFTTSQGGDAGIHAWRIISTDSVTAGSLSYDLLPSNDTMGAQRYCSNCYTSLENAQQTGIPVWWNGQKWKDALGNDPRH